MSAPFDGPGRDDRATPQLQQNESFDNVPLSPPPSHAQRQQSRSQGQQPNASRSTDHFLRYGHETDYDPEYHSTSSGEDRRVVGRDGDGEGMYRDDSRDTDVETDSEERLRRRVSSPVYRRTPPEEQETGGPPDYFSERTGSDSIDREEQPGGVNGVNGFGSQGRGTGRVRYAEDTVVFGSDQRNPLTGGGRFDNAGSAGGDVYLDGKGEPHTVTASTSRSGPTRDTTLPIPSQSPLLNPSDASSFLLFSQPQERQDSASSTFKPPISTNPNPQTAHNSPVYGYTHFTPPPSTAPSSEAEGAGGGFGDYEEDDFDWSNDEDNGGAADDDNPNRGKGKGDGGDVKPKGGKKTIWQRFALYRVVKPLFTTFIGNMFLILILLAPAFAVRYTYRFSGDQNKVYVADNVEAWMYWISYNIGVNWGVHFLIELLPKGFLLLVQVVWGDVSETMRSRVEVFQASKTWMRFAIYGGMFWGSFAVIFNSIFKLRNDNDPPNSRAHYTYRLYQVIETLFFAILVLCIEKLLILLVSLNFHSVAYAERIKENVKTLSVLDKLKDWRPKTRPRRDRFYLGGSGISTPAAQGGKRPGYSRNNSNMDGYRPGIPRNNSNFESMVAQGLRNAGYGGTASKLHGGGGAGGERQGVSIVSTPKPVHQRVTASPDVTDDDEAFDPSAAVKGKRVRKAKKTGTAGSGSSSFSFFRRKGTGSTLGAAEGAIGGKNTKDEVLQMQGLGRYGRNPNFRQQPQQDSVDSYGRSGTIPGPGGIELGQRPQGSSGDSYAQQMQATRSRSSTLSMDGLGDGKDGGGGGGGGAAARPGLGARRASSTNALTKFVTSKGTTAAALAVQAMKDPVATLRREKGGIGLDITSPSQAKRLARNLFWAFRADPARKYLITSDFYPAFKTVKEAKESFAIFDKDGNGDISRAEIKAVVMQAYKERRFLARSLQDMSHAVGRLDALCVVVGVIAVFFIALPVFEIDISKTLTTFYSLGIAAAFIFKNAAQNLFDSVIFLFVTHAFDSGDRIFLDEEVLVVKQMGLLATVFLRWDGTEMWISNAKLATKFITNLRRSPYQFENCTIQIAWNTPLSKLEELEKRMNNWLQTDEKRMFEPSTACVIQHMDFCNSMEITIGMTHRANWQDWGERWVRRTAFHIAVSHYTRELGITCTNPMQPVQYWMSDLNQLPQDGSDYDGDDLEPLSAVEPATAVDDGTASIEPTGKAKPFLGFVAPEGQTGLRQRKAKSRRKAFRGDGAG